MGAAWAADYYILDIDYFNSVSNQTLTEVNFSNVFYWVTLWPVTALSIKRFHDLGLSGWVYVIIFLIWLALDQVFLIQTSDTVGSVLGFLLSFTGLEQKQLIDSVRALPTLGTLFYWTATMLLGLALIVITLFMPGNPGDNRYGADPLDGPVSPDSNVAKQEDASPPWS